MIKPMAFVTTKSKEDAVVSEFAESNQVITDPSMWSP